MEFALQIIIQNTSISHARRQSFNRALNFVKVPRLCTIQNASNSQAIIHLRTPFLQNSFQWLLPNFSYFLKKEKKNRNSFFIPPLCLIRLKSCNCTKIVKTTFIHNFEKKFSNLSSVSFKFCNIKYRSSHQRSSIKKVFLEVSQNSQENTCVRISFLRTFFIEHLWTTASQNMKTTLLTFHIMLTFSFELL